MIEDDTGPLPPPYSEEGSEWLVYGRSGLPTPTAAADDMNLFISQHPEQIRWDEPPQLTYDTLRRYGWRGSVRKPAHLLDAELQEMAKKHVQTIPDLHTRLQAVERAVNSLRFELRSYDHDTKDDDY